MRIRLFSWAILLVLPPTVSFWFANAARAEVAVCPPVEALGRLEEYNLKLNAELAGKHIPILKEIGSISSKAKNDSLPIGPQLTKADQDRFQQLREQSIAIQGQEILNSNYLRDSRVIMRAAKVAYDLTDKRGVPRARKS